MNQYLLATLVAISATYIIKFKQGHYPDLIRSLIIKLANNLPKINVYLMNREQVVTVGAVDNKDFQKTEVEYVTEKYSLGEWLKFLVNCPFCLFNWVFLALATREWFCIIFIVTHASFIIASTLVNKKKHITLQLLALTPFCALLFLFAADIFLSITLSFLAQEFLFKKTSQIHLD